MKMINRSLRNGKKVGKQGHGGSDSHRQAPTPTLADIKLGVKANIKYWERLEEFELNDWPLTSSGEKQTDKRLDLQDMKTYDYNFAFENIKIMDWVTSMKGADEVTEITRLTLSVYLNSKAANAMVERFFSTVGIVANSRNMNLQNEKIEMRALVKANDDLVGERLHCEMPELPEDSPHVPYGSEILYSSRRR